MGKLLCCLWLGHSLVLRREAGDVVVTAFQGSPYPWPLASNTRTFLTHTPVCSGCPFSEADLS